MKKHQELCMEMISLNLMNYWRKIYIHTNIQTLVIQIFKLLNGLSPQIMKDVFQVKSPAPYYLRDKNELYSRNPKTEAYESESVSFMALKIWSIVPQELKNSQSLYSFKKGIRKW